MEKYNVLKILGEGSFGRVLLVHQKERNQKYAMKEIRLPKSTLDTENVWNESVLLAKMRHPNIVAFAESFAADGHLYIVMEYCDDGDLMEKIRQRRGKSFPEDMILDWFAQICLGVKYIHDKRVLHRDLKSKNIFLTQQGKIKLGDFGSALLLKSPTAYAFSYVGTPYYVPPEIWENLPYNNKSDIWSLGCILYELCTLKHPFQANNWKHLILKICKGFFSPLPSQFSYELHYLIKQMLKKNPKNRPSASTILTKKFLIKHIRRFSLTEGEGKCEKNKDSCSGAEAIPNYSCQRELEKTCVDIKATDFLTSQRRQWEKRRSNTVMNILENAALFSSRTPTMEDTSSSMRKPDEKILHKQWTKEPPETLMNILHNADISLAFNTYTVYKAGNPLRGPLTEDIKASDEPDGDIIAEDPESLEPRSDEEDTDFEEEHDPDWVSELKRITKMNDQLNM